MRLFRSQVRRLARRPATLVTYLLLIGLVLLVMLAVTVAAQQALDPQSALASRLILSFPGAWTLTLTMTVGIGGLLALTFGAAIAGSEWAWGTLKSAIARGEGRAWYVLTAIAGTVVMAWLGTLLAYLAGVAGAAAGATVISAPHDLAPDAAVIGHVAGLLARAALAIAMDVAIGFAVASIAKSQLAGIGAGIGLYIGEGIIGAFLPGVVKWAPFAAASAMMAGGAPGLGGAAVGSSSGRLDGDVAIVVTGVWLVLALAVAAVWTERSEIGG